MLKCDTTRTMRTLGDHALRYTPLLSWLDFTALRIHPGASGRRPPVLPIHQVTSRDPQEFPHCRPTANRSDLYIKRREKQSSRGGGAGIRGGRECDRSDGRSDGRADPDASEIRTGAGSLQLVRRNPSLVVFYNLRQVRMMYWVGGGRKRLFRRCHPAVWKRRAVVWRRLCTSGFAFFYSARVSHPALSTSLWRQRQQQQQQQYCLQQWWIHRLRSSVHYVIRIFLV